MRPRDCDVALDSRHLGDEVEEAARVAEPGGIGSQAVDIVVAGSAHVGEVGIRVGESETRVCIEEHGNLRFSAQLEGRKTQELLLARNDARPDAGIAFEVAEFAHALIAVNHLKAPGDEAFRNGLAELLRTSVEDFRSFDDLALVVALDGEGVVGFAVGKRKVGHRIVGPLDQANHGRVRGFEAVVEVAGAGYESFGLYGLRLQLSISTFLKRGAIDDLAAELHLGAVKDDGGLFNAVSFKNLRRALGWALNVENSAACINVAGNFGSYTECNNSSRYSTGP